MAAITASGGTTLGEGRDAGGALGAGGVTLEPGLSLQAPAQAFDPADFLDHLAPEGVTRQVTGPAS